MLVASAAGVLAAVTTGAAAVVADAELLASTKVNRVIDLLLANHRNDFRKPKAHRKYQGALRKV